MKSATQPVLLSATQDLLKLDSQLNPSGDPVTAGSPTLMPCSLRGARLLIQVAAAASAGISVPPVDFWPSGSLKART